jgi:hypothetical protein
VIYSLQHADERAPYRGSPEAKERRMERKTP